MNLQVYKPLFYFGLMSSETYKLKTQKRCGQLCDKYAMISNSYDSANCIRFEGMISARRGTPLSLSGKDKRKSEYAVHSEPIFLRITFMFHEIKDCFHLLPVCHAISTFAPI